MTGASTGPARVTLVGFEDQDNLGLRYLSSRLRERGHRTRIVTVTSGPGPVLDAIRDFNPHIVGFSLIFQYLVPQFGELLANLRDAGVAPPIIMGGDYCYLEPHARLGANPRVDSVAPLEGE